jgi:Amt family ammonium transporter
MYSLKYVRLLRVDAEGEIQGLDRHEHGMPAYPEFVIQPHGALRGAGAARPAPSPSRAAAGAGDSGA